ncbi:efflux RND transporter periplasmic adaptor subunit [Sporomusa acidovorans]|uniref:Multidrug resistance protein MdtE n=1 Tax=Sporomusa acidovorans (strain ATCC 49682 / DSM 3132 / Mol) TaxID=1123286 RepID=A0ABZ3IXX3_SPOA4|nr:efflux RND transporter periplasmic adaptor subunit [Sporomusa acidovorans]OZC16959.1 multidrug resistance protein MdtE precursor [Sporomusa acidovorans DSM 3132]SDE13754.1 RND family efflux transporter, MFP subunit [Sporomusa acidovorans]
MQQLKYLNKIPKKQIVYGLAILLVIGIIGGMIWKGQHQPQPVADVVSLVRTTTVGMTNAAQKYTYSGEVRGRYESQLAFQVGGKIVKRHVDLGSVIKAGDALMEIDPKDINQTVNANAAQVYSAQSQLKLAENNLNRYRQLYAQNAISQAQLDQYQSAYDAAVAAVQQTSAQYMQGTNQLGYSTLYANSAGVISAVSAEAGQVVSAGQAVLTLVQDGDREIEISVPENRIEELRQATQIQATFWALPGVTVDGKVREISPMADKISRTYKVRISLINPPAEVKLGMTAAVAAIHPGSQQIAVIPLSAVYQTGDTPSVWVVQNDTVSLKPITVSQFGDNQVQVLNGLQTGDVVVTAGVHKLREGQKVRVTGDNL